MDHYREITKRGLLHLPTLRQLLKWDEFHVPLYFVSLISIFLDWNDREVLFTFSLDLYIQISSKNQIWEALPEREKHYVQPKKHHGGNLPEVPATGVMVKYINQMWQQEGWYAYQICWQEGWCAYKMCRQEGWYVYQMRRQEGW